MTISQEPAKLNVFLHIESAHEECISE